MITLNTGRGAVFSELIGYDVSSPSDTSGNRRPMNTVRNVNAYRSNSYLVIVYPEHAS